MKTQATRTQILSVGLVLLLGIGLFFVARGMNHLRPDETTFNVATNVMFSTVILALGVYSWQPRRGRTWGLLGLGVLYFGYIALYYLVGLG